MGSGAGGGDFSYSSCSNQTEPEGYMEGAFRFSHGATAALCSHRLQPSQTAGNISLMMGQSASDGSDLQNLCAAGATAHPTGGDFEVKCPRFALIKRQFIF